MKINKIQKQNYFNENKSMHRDYLNAKIIPAVFITLIMLFQVFCSKEKNPLPNQGTPEKSVVSENGSTIKLPEEEAVKFKTTRVEIKSVSINLQAPGRTVASIVQSSDMQPLVIFETQEISQLYSDYSKNKAAFSRARKQLERVNELYKNSAASGKDVTDAETDYSQSEAAVKDSETRLRQNGLNPGIITRLKPGSVLIIADVPENKIRYVDMGEQAVMEFNSFPGDKFYGRVISISDSIDPSSKTIKVGIDLLSRAGRIKPGMISTISIEESKTLAAIVPQNAMVSAEAKNYVFIKISGTTFERREVITGEIVNKDIVILSGVHKGEEVVVDNSILLKGISFGY